MKRPHDFAAAHFLRPKPTARFQLASRGCVRKPGHISRLRRTDKELVGFDLQRQVQLVDDIGLGVFEALPFFLADFCPAVAEPPVR